MSGGKWLLGDYDTARDKFVVTADDDFNFSVLGPGRGACAVGAAGWEGRRRILIFNMNPGNPPEAGIK